MSRRTRRITVADLELLNAKWVELFDELRHMARIKDQIAAPFLSVPSAEARSILYVGKATAKDWYRDDTVFGLPCTSMIDGVYARIKERHEVTQQFVAKEAPTYNSGFWQFARELNAVAAQKWKLPLRGSLQHITVDEHLQNRRLERKSERPPFQ
jgi:hypothetical protein